jgi:hypothetical protein
MKKVSKFKSWLIHRLLQDTRIRKIALREIIKDAEVHQIDARGAESVELIGCVVVNSAFSDIKSGKIIDNHFDNTTITHNMLSSAPAVTIRGIKGNDYE